MKTSPIAIRSALLSFFCFIAFSFPSHAFDLEQKVRKYTLANGLRLLIVERPISPTVSIQIKHCVGAADEMNGKTGTAHFLEHMMFKGTTTIGAGDYQTESKHLERVFTAGNALDAERRKGDGADAGVIRVLEKELAEAQKAAGAFTIKSEIDRLYTENGASHHNATTGQDLTSYYVSLPANRLELWARIESDRMKNPVFREFYSERDVIGEERRQSIESNPSRMLMERFLASAFTVHPYGRPVIGLSTDIGQLSAETLRHFFNTYYAPNNTVIAVVGAVSASAVHALVEKYFGGIPPSAQARSQIISEPVQNSERRAHVVLPANPEILIGYHKPTLPAYDDYVFDVIDAILSKGRTSRLYRIIVEEKGLAQSIDTSTGFPGSRYPNLFVVHAKTRDPHTCLQIENAVYEEIEYLKQTPVPASELEKIKNQLRMDFLRDLESNSGIASKLSYYETIAGDYRYITRHLSIIEKITPEDIMKTAGKYLNANNRTVAILSRSSK